MVYCLVKKCPSQSAVKTEKKLSFYSVPKIILNQCSRTKELSSKRRVAWLNIIKRPDLLMHNGRYMNKVCSEHFITGVPASLMDEHNPDWVPTQNLENVKPVSKKKLLSSVERHQRFLQRSRRKLLLERSRASSSNASSKNIAPVERLDTSSEVLYKPDNQNGGEVQTIANFTNYLESTYMSDMDYILPEVWPLNQEEPSTSFVHISNSNGQNEAFNEVQIITGPKSNSLDNNFNSSESSRTINENFKSTPKVNISRRAKKNVRDMWTQIEITYANAGTQTISVIDDEVYLRKPAVNSKVNSSCQSDLTFSTISSLSRMPMISK